MCSVGVSLYSKFSSHFRPRFSPHWRFWPRQTRIYSTLDTLLEIVLNNNRLSDSHTNTTHTGIRDSSAHTLIPTLLYQISHHGASSVFKPFEEVQVGFHDTLIQYLDLTLFQRLVFLGEQSGPYTLYQTQCSLPCLVLTRYSWQDVVNNTLHVRYL